MKNIGIIGCGWLGLHIAEFFSEKHNLFVTTTSEAKKNFLDEKGYKVYSTIFPDEIHDYFEKWSILNDLDCIIITVPFPKKADKKSLLNRFENISRFIKEFNNSLFLMSSTGIYPDFNIEISENTITEEHLNKNILSVENLMKTNFPQINILRLGGLMGGSRKLSNYKISSLEQIVNHIHYHDVCKIIEEMVLQNKSSKIYNVVAPEHSTKQQIIDWQKNQQISDNQSVKDGRKISSGLMRAELDYKFAYPNPVTFP